MLFRNFGIVVFLCLRSLWFLVLQRLLHLCLGVAVEDDIYEDARQQIEQELAHREAVETATRILNEILDGVRTPERARSPVDAYITVSAVS